MNRWLTSMTTAEPSHNLLLDTHTLIWLATDDARISERARTLVGDLKYDLYLSVASVWELAIKKSLGKIDLQMPLAAFVKSQKPSACSHGICCREPADPTRLARPGPRP